MRPIHVWAPAYANCSAGIRACYQLAADINALGCKADVHNADWPTPNVNDDVWVYPDIYAGNPGRGAGVVRWLLGPEKYPADEGDLVFAWPGADDGSRPRLCVPIIETEWFCPKREPGHVVLGWVGKGIPQPTAFLPSWITHYDPPTRDALAAKLQSAALLVSFDSRSSICLEATLCGTPVRMWDRPPDHDSLFPTAGWAFSDDEVPDAAAEASSGLAWVFYNDVTLPAISGDVTGFLETVEATFG